MYVSFRPTTSPIMKCKIQTPNLDISPMLMLFNRRAIFKFRSERVIYDKGADVDLNPTRVVRKTRVAKQT